MLFPRAIMINISTSRVPEIYCLLWSLIDDGPISGIRISGALAGTK
jgi:hypothetical protein